MSGKNKKNLLADLRKNWRNWRWWRERYSSRVFRHFIVNRGTYIVDEIWDNLIILDACRFDVFKELNTIPGKLESRISRGSCTRDFLIDNFAKHPKYVTFKDIVYVTANPFVDLLLPKKFHKIYSVWKNGWDENLKTVPPHKVVDETIKACDENPDKRLIIHFMQPHSPFLQLKYYHGTGINNLRSSILRRNQFIWDEGWWNLVEKGKLNLKDVKFAYRENLRIVLQSVRYLISEILSGRTIITSDHGNLFGERPHILYPFKEYGHPDGLLVKQLIEVPWLIFDNENKKSLEAKRIRLKILRLKKREQI